MLEMGVYSGHIVEMSEQNRPGVYSDHIVAMSEQNCLYWDHTWDTVELVVAIEVSRVRIACPV